ncbi:hypothetical protein BDV25DRAFT_158920 [Aspergillus avenaceus]|uniref:RING-type domain-containing protein n=1 Tax=Aspergillus avenaceus TaxID=36643 RepID=A0A5N6TP59_ASPAV|nr:hypothetical protein BDV25DRAFT_158920 [Aspergillus avenaceus]
MERRSSYDQTYTEPSAVHFLPRRRQSSDNEPLAEGRKRRRLSHTHPTTGVSHPSQEDGDEAGSIDLTEVQGSSALSKVLAKQREDAVRAQLPVEHEEGLSALKSYKCPVCMDTPEDATTTICGHMFCHKCIIDTLKFGEEQRADAPGKGPRGTCPVCRKALSRNDAPGTKRNLVPLQLKLTTKKRSTIARNS